MDERCHSSVCDIFYGTGVASTNHLVGHTHACATHGRTMHVCECDCDALLCCEARFLAIRCLALRDVCMSRSHGCLNLPFQQIDQQTCTCSESGLLTSQCVRVCMQMDTVHLDIKSANIILTPDAVAKICDFGNAG
jgi:hypothetical protein